MHGLSLSFTYLGKPPLLFPSTLNSLLMSSLTALIRVYYKFLFWSPASLNYKLYGPGNTSFITTRALKVYIAYKIAIPL